MFDLPVHDTLNRIKVLIISGIICIKMQIFDHINLF